MILNNGNDNGAVIMVYTGNSAETIIETGIVSDVRFNSGRMDNVKYVVCCQNAAIEGATAPHNAAFLIGIVSGYSDPDSNGYRNITISDYATIIKRGAWYARKQTSHFFFSNLRQAKIRLGRYDFQPVGSMKPVKAKRASVMATGRGLRKVDKFPVGQPPVETETPQASISASLEGDIRASIAGKLGVKVSQVNVTITISI